MTVKILITPALAAASALALSKKIFHSVSFPFLPHYGYKKIYAMRTLLKFIPVLLLIVISCTSPKQKEQLVQQPAITIDTSFRDTELVAVAKVENTTKRPVKQKLVIKKEVTINSIYKKLQKNPQVFKVSVSKDTVITCKEGTKLTIPSNCFITKSGKEVTGTVQLKTEEFYTKSDILLAGLTTLSDGKLLESGGMLNLLAYAGGEEVLLKQGKSIRIEMPANQKQEGMQLFNGVKDKDGKVNWVLAERRKIIKKEKKDTAIVFTKAYNEVVNETIRIENAKKEELVSKKNDYPWAEYARKTDKYTIYKFSFYIFSNGTTQMINFFKQGKLIRFAEVSFSQPVTGKCRYGYYETSKIDFSKSLNIEINNKSRDLKEPRPITIHINNLNYVAESLKVFPYKLEATIELGPSGYEVKRADIEERITANQQVSGEELSFYIFNTPKLGYINCDRFYGDPAPRVAFKVAGGKDSEVKLLFTDLNSYMSSFDSASANYFKNVPINKKITVVAIKVVDNTPYLAVKESNTSEKQVQLDYEKVTTAELKERMKKLNAM